MDCDISMTSVGRPPDVVEISQSIEKIDGFLIVSSYLKDYEKVAWKYWTKLFEFPKNDGGKTLLENLKESLQTNIFLNFSKRFVWSDS